MGTALDHCKGGFNLGRRLIVAYPGWRVISTSQAITTITQITVQAYGCKHILLSQTKSNRRRTPFPTPPHVEDTGGRARTG